MESRYLTLCAHYGFTPTRSLPGHPWSKGKVEKPFSFIETHFIAGSSFEDFLDLQNKLKNFQREVNNRVHSTTKTKPAELFNKKNYLYLPSGNRYVGVKEDNRKVSYDCLISYNGSRYSVPWMFAGKFVWIKISKGYYLQIYSQANKLIAEHNFHLRKAAVLLSRNIIKAIKPLQEVLKHLKRSSWKVFPSIDVS